MEEVVTKLSGVNDPSEHAVKAAGDRIGSVRSEKAFQASLLTLEKMHRLFSDKKRGTFTEKKLSTLTRKMLEMEDTEKNPQYNLLIGNLQIV